MMNPGMIIADVAGKKKSFTKILPMISIGTLTMRLNAAKITNHIGLTKGILKKITTLPIKGTTVKVNLHINTTQIEEVLIVSSILVIQQKVQVKSGEMLMGLRTKKSFQEMEDPNTSPNSSQAATTTTLGMNKHRLFQEIPIQIGGKRKKMVIRDKVGVRISTNSSKRNLVRSLTTVTIKSNFIAKKVRICTKIHNMKATLHMKMPANMKVISIILRCGRMCGKIVITFTILREMIVKFTNTKEKRQILLKSQNIAIIIMKTSRPLQALINISLKLVKIP